MRKGIVALALGILMGIGPSAVAAGKLVLIGGGKRPVEAVQRFSQWAGGAEARYLVISWGQGEPSAVAALKQELSKQGFQELNEAPAYPFEAAERAKTLRWIREATGIFFTGGDQRKIMRVLADAELAQALRERFEQGVVVGGTSAGTAIMSRVMLTGDGDFTVIDGSRVETAPGLGLLPGHVLVDQHFIKRMRMNRLMGPILDDLSKVGLGIDENSAVLVDGQGMAQVTGQGGAVLISSTGEAQELRVKVLKPGDSFSLN